MGRIALNLVSLVIGFSLLHSCKGGGKDADAAALVIQNQQKAPSPTPPPTSAGKSLIGGFNTGGVDTPLAYTYSVDNLEDPIPITGIAPVGEILSVSIDAGGIKGLLGGVDSVATQPLLYQVDVATSSATSVSGISLGDTINSVSINSSGVLGIAGGDRGNAPVAYVIDLSTNTATTIASLPSSGTIYSVAIDTNSGIIGGGDFIHNPSIPFALFIDATNPLSPITTNMALGATDGVVASVAIDQTGSRGVIGLHATSGPEIAYTTTGTTAHVVSFTTIPAEITSVAINRPGTAALLGGSSATSADACAYVVTDFTNPIAYDIQGISSTAFGLTSVAIDTLGVRGLFGGNDGFQGFAYVIDIANKSATSVTIPKPSSIHSVEIQDTGSAGLLGGTLNSNAAAFLLPDLINQPTLVIQLNLVGLGPNGVIRSVSVDAIGSLLNQIPTNGLSGNNLALANYLNENASNTVAYFIPAYLEGTLSQALESVAPTRNAASLFAMNNSFFAIEEAVTQRTRDARQHHRIASSALDPQCMSPCPLKELWGDLIGLNAYQSHQNQMPGFNPWSIGLVLGYDLALTQYTRVGGALAYMYNHLHQNNGQGHSKMSQEYLSFYTMWERAGFFTNTSLWLGLFQINNVRQIQMSAFDFRQHSFTRGVQFNPHLELGYDFNFHHCDYTLEPFGMVDWIHSWQTPSQEFGDFPFRFVQQYLHASVLRAETGLRCYETFRFASWNLVLQESLSYVYRNPFSIGSVRGFLFDAPGTLVLETFTDAEHMGSAGIVFLFEPNCTNYPTGTLGYKAEFGSGYQSHLVTLGVEWGF